MTRALVIGSGVAGPVLAMALSRIGVDCTVFERDQTSDRRGGSWLTLQANGMDALDALGLAEPVESLGFDVEHLSFVNGRGKSLGRMPMAAPRADGRCSQMLQRDELYRVLTTLAAEHGVETVYGKELVDGSVTSDGVRAQFSDGSTASGELLIGCDGIHSRVRVLIDPHAAAPRYVPVLNVGGYVPDFTVDVPAREFRMQFGTRCFFAWTPTPDGGIVWFANPPMAREPEHGVLSGMSDAQWRAWLHELMDGDVGPAPEIIDAAPGPMFGWATYDMPVVRRWHNSRMLIIGDAAHATAPSAGQGASMALEDAAILAMCLRDAPDVAAAFDTFVSARRRRVARIVKHGARSANSKAVGPIGRIVRDAFLPLAFARVAREGGASMRWLQGHHIGFDEPAADLLLRL